MSEILFFTFAALALFAALLFPASYLLTWVLSLDPPFRRDTAQASVAATSSTTGNTIIGSTSLTAETSNNGFEWFAAA
jgi:hypothetical protein